MYRTVTAFGREWWEKEFRGLVNQLLKDGFTVLFEPYDGESEPCIGHTCLCCVYGGSYDRVGSGSTLWLALCDAVGGMEAGDNGSQ